MKGQKGVEGRREAGICARTGEIRLGKGNTHKKEKRRKVKKLE